MKSVILMIVYALFVSTVVFTACANNGDSSATSNTSHNAGQSCIETGCHADSSPTFAIAGTVYSAGTGGNTASGVKITVKDATGTNTIGTLTSDDSGNFYTTDTTTYPNATYVFSTKNGVMTPTVTTLPADGSCNQGGCHDGTNNVTPVPVNGAAGYRTF
ncbi:MAG: hypothetical protein ABUK01_09105 [Leptospirales bacterium]